MVRTKATEGGVRRRTARLVLGALLATSLALPGLAQPQTSAEPAPRDPAVAEAAAERAGDAAAAGPDGASGEEAADPMSPEALDALVAPVALYPDPLLAQVLVAATYPLEIVKAARWVGESEALADDARAEAAEAEGWDPAVSVLAAGFPSVVERMADDLDTTEALGDAVLVDTDAVLDAIQRQRARAAALGNLDSNEAQSVTVEGDSITIAPADPQVVYVPAYDATLAYSQPVAAAPVVVTDPDDDDYDSGDLLATGVIAFGAGLLVGEIFDDDDDWGGYWGAPAFGWNNGAVYPRPGRGGVYVDGDVNISRDRVRVDRDDAWRPDQQRADGARERVAARGGAPRDGARPATGEREAARERISARSEAAGAQPRRPGADGGARVAPREGARQATRGEAFTGRGEGLSGAHAATRRGEASGARATPRREQGGDRARAPSGQRASPSRQSGFDRSADRGGSRAAASSNRGARSAGSGGGRSGGGGGGGRSGGGRGR